VTGFEPWGGRPRNASSEAAAILDGADLPGGARARALSLPVALAPAVALLEDVLARVRPVAVVALGIHGTVGGPIRLEEVAVNLQDYREPDIRGEVVRGPVDPEGPAELASTLPLDEIEQAIRARGVPIERSRDAGRFLCNATFYWLSRRVALGKLDAAGFVHVPPRAPGEAIDDIVVAAEAALEATAVAIAAKELA
jgi:pyroglutamyl-peptidase